MRKHRRTLLLAALVILALAVAFAWLVLSSGPSDPVYAGKHLSSWLTIYFPDTQYRSKEIQAVPEEDYALLETNALPLLWNWLQANDPPWKVKALVLLEKQHFIKIKRIPPLYRNYAAAAAFHRMGPAASNAVPALIDIYGRNISFESQFYTALSLGEMGPSAKVAVPILIHGLTNSNPLLRQASLQSLGEIHSEPEKVVPLLIQALGSANPYEREYAVDALAGFGTNAAPAVPALLKLLRGGGNPRVLDKATAALKTIAPQAAAKAGFK